MCPDGFDHLCINPEDRIKGHHRILKHHGDFGTAQFPILFLGILRQVFPLKQDLSAGHFTGCINKAQDGKAGHGFTGTGFPDQT